MRTSKDTRRSRGFTLVELLVVVAVMSILMGFLVAGAARFRRTALIHASQAAVENLAVAIETYYKEYRAYPYLTPSSIEDLSLSSAFADQFWDNGDNCWKPEAANAALVYQMLLPRGKGPYLDPSKGDLPLQLPKNSGNQAVEIRVNNILIRLATDKFNTPLNVAWTGMVKLKNSDQRYQGYIVVEGDEYVLTTRNETIRFTSDQLVWDGSIPLVLTGLRLWSSGPDRLVDTHDDLDAVVTGR